jgi:hypothetical protein
MKVLYLTQGISMTFLQPSQVACTQQYTPSRPGCRTRNIPQPSPQPGDTEPREREDKVRIPHDLGEAPRKQHATERRAMRRRLRKEVRDAPHEQEPASDLHERGEERCAHNACRQPSVNQSINMSQLPLQIPTPIPPPAPRLAQDIRTNKTMHHLESRQTLHQPRVLVQLAKHLAAPEALEPAIRRAPKERARFTCRAHFMRANRHCLVQHARPERGRDGVVREQVGVFDGRRGRGFARCWR